MSKQPKLLDFSRMRVIFEPHLAQIREHVFFSNEIGIVKNGAQVFRLIIQQEPPFAINDHRFGVIVNGHARVNINLVEKSFEPGTMVFVGPGTIISPIEFSNDLEILGMALFPGFPMPFAPGQLPPAFNGHVRDFQICGKESDILTVRHIIDTLWHVVHQKDFNPQTVSSMVAAMMHHYDGLYRQHQDLLLASQSREQTIFDRFIQLVNQHCAEQHHLGYYANRMCLTERYLGTVIRKASGITAKEWIDRALVEHIKIELKHSDKSIVQISEEMNFNNPAFFSKYFKRLTAQTPLQYKQSN